MTRIYFIRHASTHWNISHRAQGHADIELSGEGARQAVWAARQLTPFNITAVYASDLRRAYDTAKLIAKSHGVDLVMDPDFREINQGEWEGLRTEEIKERWPDIWGPARHYSPRPGGESPIEVRRRALRAIKRIVEEHPDEEVVVVSHGGTIRWISAEALGLDDLGSASIRGLSNGGGVRLDAHLSPEGELVLGHLERLDGKSPLVEA